ncbi:soluble lytic murein transglycosylase [Desulfobotulus alkaliphilus]|uniref:Soluble lytic murein transglycosylase n=1 Tax=Desulfobotulus alkaliphilus TaxID=622671 RepID=A0A562S2G4_9BACT|nr:lytic transglycosylase domain-containing protein [Desulfobotulus alkaliphilus]TWI75532.1 soluble lytic murein transglycosylase [Desulfobotulus alkaliphilus]
MIRHISLVNFFVFFIHALLFFYGEAAADIYMYVDEKGIVRFTNTPTSSNYKFFMSERGDKKGSDTGKLTFYDENIRVAANYHGVDPFLVKAVVRAESSFNPKAVSPKGAQGLMQLMPSTSRELGVRDPFNPRENIMAGTRYLRMMLDMFEEDVELALAAYNAGPSTVKRYGGVPPFSETLNYIKRVLEFREEYRK